MTHTPTFAFATSAQYPDMTPEDRQLVNEVRHLGCDTRVIVWDDPTTNLAGVDMVVIRCCWDYATKAKQFLQWLLRVDELGIPLLNPLPVLQWGIDKSYLVALEARGAPVVPSRRVPTLGSDRHRMDVLASAMEELGGSDFIVKPIIGCESLMVSRVHKRDPEGCLRALTAIGPHSDALVQPFLPEILDWGECSLVYLGGRFSHAVRKYPRDGDFRVQRSFGGDREAVEPPGHMIATATSLLELLEPTPVFARIDGIGRTNFLVTEVEALEPHLYLEYGEGSVIRLATLIVNSLKTRGSTPCVSLPQRR
jgi:glutathione synthase/RimK-type ligase-like ATP-grasp enzyme